MHGCGICVALAPAVMGLDARGKAFARTRIVEWSPADGGFVHECPTDAIEAQKIERLTPSSLTNRAAAAPSKPTSA